MHEALDDAARLSLHWLDVGIVCNDFGQKPHVGAAGAVEGAEDGGGGADGAGGAGRHARRCFLRPQLIFARRLPAIVGNVVVLMVMGAVIVEPAGLWGAAGGVGGVGERRRWNARVARRRWRRNAHAAALVVDDGAVEVAVWRPKGDGVAAQCLV